MNNILLNNWLLWNAPFSKATDIRDSGKIIFNWYNLHDLRNKIVWFSDHDDLWSINYETYNYSRADWWNALAKYYRTKRITMQLTLKANSEEELNDLIDEFKLQTSAMQGNLDIIINWLVRRWEATVISLEFWRKNYNITFCQNVKIVFDCVNPFAFNLTSISKSYYWCSWTFVSEFIYSWKVNCYPTFYIIFNNASDLSEFYIDANWYLFEIDQEINAWDILIIDGQTKLAKLNWVVIPYKWPFPIIQPWLNNFEFSLQSGALANYDVVFIYKKYFL